MSVLTRCLYRSHQEILEFMRQRSCFLHILNYVKYFSKSCSVKRALTHYEILKIDVNCPQSKIKEAYIKRTKECHPDLQMSGDKGDIHDQIVAINEAYIVLSKPSSRFEYDQRLKATRGHLRGTVVGSYYDDVNVSSRNPQVRHRQMSQEELLKMRQMSNVNLKTGLAVHFFRHLMGAIMVFFSVYLMLLIREKEKEKRKSKKMRAKEDIFYDLS